MDAECYRLAYQFVCHVLQPPCQSASEYGLAATIVRPCRDFCLDFHAGCGARLPQRFQEALDCSKFPEFSMIGEECVPKPGTIKYFKIYYKLFSGVDRLLLRGDTIIVPWGVGGYGI